MGISLIQNRLQQRVSCLTHLNGSNSNPAAAGSEDSCDEIPQISQEAKTPKPLNHNSSSSKKKKKKHPAIVHTKYKYSVDQLPELLDYMYNIRNSSAKYKIVEAWKDEKLRIEICSNLEDLGQNRPLPRIKKSLKGHKNLY